MRYAPQILPITLSPRYPGRRLCQRPFSQTTPNIKTTTYLTNLPTPPPVRPAFLGFPIHRHFPFVFHVSHLYSDATVAGTAISQSDKDLESHEELNGKIIEGFKLDWSWCVRYASWTTMAPEAEPEEPTQLINSGDIESFWLGQYNSYLSRHSRWLKLIPQTTSLEYCLAQGGVRVSSMSS